MTFRFKSICLALLFALLPAASTTADDFVRLLQESASRDRAADWGHWGPNPDAYSSWTSHSNRLIPIYTFGIDLASVAGKNSVYRDESRIREFYGFVPEETLNAEAECFDQTDVYRLQMRAAEAGKRCIVLFVFDGIDWPTTWAAATYKSGRVAYRGGRGTGLHFLDYRGAASDYGFFVTSPHNEGTNVDVSGQKIKNPGGEHSPDCVVAVVGQAVEHALSTVGAIGNHVNMPRFSGTAEQREHLDGQLGACTVAPPMTRRGILVQVQAKQDRQAEDALATKWETHHHAQHHPTMAPVGDRLAAAGQQRIVMHAHAGGAI